MVEAQALRFAGGRVTISAGGQLAVQETTGDLRLLVDRPDTEVLCALDVTAGATGGTLTVLTRSRPGTWCAVLVEGGNHFRPVRSSIGEGRSQTFVLRLRAGQHRRLVVVTHPERLRASAVGEAMPRLTPPHAEPPRLEVPRDLERAFAVAPEGVAPPMAAAMAPPVRHPFHTANGGGGGAVAPPVLAQVGASMPRSVRLGDPVPVDVRLSRGEVRIIAGRAHDEQVIIVDPGEPLSVTLLRRGFDLDEHATPGETGTRNLRLPAPGAPDVRVTFSLRAAHQGDAEVQVVVRQGHPLPLANLRLTATVLPASATAVDEPEEVAAPEVVAEVARGVTPFLSPRTLTIDENLVGSTSELSFELVIHGVRRSFEHRVIDKTVLLTSLFEDLKQAWKKDHLVADHEARRAAFHRSLQSLGARLARETLPPELLLFFRYHLGDVRELTIITSGETDVPWELVHVWDDDAGDDPEGRGFLGRSGLVRWVYNTPHPAQLRVRNGAARYLIPRYLDSALVLPKAARELEYLKPFGARAVSPADAGGLSRLLRGDDLDLLHFAGHGRTDDSCDPPVREMLLAGASTLKAIPGQGPGRSKAAYGLVELRRALENRPSGPSDPGPLVVLNACGLGQAPSTRFEMGGFAETFLRGGAGAFVGCLWSVGDEPARAFVESFYAGLGAGSTMSRATVEARHAAQESGDLSWLAYTVYAHPDATLASTTTTRELPPTDEITQRRGTAMTTTASTTRGTGLTPDQLVAMHPYVIDVPDGKLADGPPSLPTSVDDFKTTKADVDAIFENYLPAYIGGREQPVPLVIWAHGGLVKKESGLGIAHHQVEWWKDNGVFPVQFVWETGLASSLWDVLKGSLPGRQRGFIDDAYDTVIEGIVRKVPGAIATWGAMKTTSRLASEEQTGGAWYFATKLGEYVKANPGAITVHAVGHSAGAIFHSYLIPQMLAAGVPSIASLDLMAPAIRVAEFKDRLMKKPVLDRIDKLAMFTMSESFEKKDTCVGIYGKSLLYLIRASLEKEKGAEILGLQECVERDDDLKKLFGAPGSGSQGEVMWSKTVGGGPHSSTTSTSHGGFDNNAPTMNSLARRILGEEDLPESWPDASTRGLDSTPGVDDGLWPSRERAFAIIDARGPVAAQDGAGRRRALCIGIDSYPPQYRLTGCVADAELWKQTFEQAGFQVDLLTNKAATRERMVEMIKDLVVSSTAGDVLALQYSGHGTTVKDFNGDEKPEFDGDTDLVDEAICPVDFNSGNLLIDDDLGEIWDLLPDGVSLTMFFDSCHSGGNQRGLDLTVPTDDNARARLVVLSQRAVTAYKKKRGSKRVRATGGDRERGVFFGACQPDEVAWEANGHGDFTRLAVPLLVGGLAGESNSEYFDRVLAAFGDQPKQTPVLLPPHLSSRRLLGSAVTTPAAAPVTEAAKALPDLTSTLPAGPVTARDHAVATVLRGVADLIES